MSQNFYQLEQSFALLSQQVGEYIDEMRERIVDAQWLLRAMAMEKSSINIEGIPGPNLEPELTAEGMITPITPQPDQRRQ